MVPHPGPGRPRRLHRPRTPILTELNARTGYRLRAQGDDQRACSATSPSSASPSTSGASRPPRSTTHSAAGHSDRAPPPLRRSTSATHGPASSETKWPPENRSAPRLTDPHASTSPQTPFLSNPTACDRPADDGIRNARLRPRNRTGGGDLSGDHRLRPAQLQPEPLGEADDHRHRLRQRARRRPQRAAVLERADPVAVGDQGDDA